MTWWATLLLFLGLLIGFFLTGLPVYLCFILIVGGAVIVFFGSAGFGMFVNSLYSTATTEALTTVPLFVLMGEILMRSGSVELLFASVDKLIGRVRGRQYHVTLALSAIIGAPAGSGIAIAAMLGRSVMRPMLKRGYDPELTSGVIMGGALLAPIIPPSVLAIIIGTLADVSISDLLLAGIIPGLVLTAMYVGAVIWKINRNPALAPAEEYVPPKPGERLKAILDMVPFSLIIIVSIGLIMFDFATPSESAALGVLAAIADAAWRRQLSMRMFLESAGESAALSAVVLIIMASAVLFGQVLAYTGAVQELGKIATDLQVNRWVMFFIMMLVPFILCMFVDQIGLMLVLIPIYEPIIKAMQFDPVWFYMQFLINMVVGAITPPFGYIIFALKAAVPEIPLTLHYRAAWLFVWITVGGMVVFTFVPDLVSGLPRMLLGK